MGNRERFVMHEGNEGLFRMVKMSLLSTKMGEPFHFHVEGLRGTGKTTVIRAVKSSLPRIKRIKGCIYNCDPLHPHCPYHVALPLEEIAEIGWEEVPMPFIEVSHSAKIGTICGSIDLEKLTHCDRPGAEILPGAIPRAHRGILFIDEINRLADTSPEIVDILLDVMGTKPGRLKIEEVGIHAVEIPVNLSVWAASNPDEDPGPLSSIRRQLSDRFDCLIKVERPQKKETVFSILKGENQTNYDDFLNCLKENTQLPIIPDSLIEIAAGIYIDSNLESIRGIEALCKGAVLNAAIEGKQIADIHDFEKVAFFALGHRTDIRNLAAVIQQLQQVSVLDQPGKSSGGKINNEMQHILDKHEKEVRAERKDKNTMFHWAAQLFPRFFHCCTNGESIGSKIEGQGREEVFLAPPREKAVRISSLPPSELIKNKEELDEIDRRAR